MKAQRPKALVVMDDRLEAASLCASMQGRGYQTAMAFNFGMGLRAATLFVPHLLLVQRGINGGDAAAFLSSLRPLLSKGLPLSICLGCGKDDPEAPMLRQAGFQVILDSPLGPQELDAAMQAAKAQLR